MGFETKKVAGTVLEGGQAEAAPCFVTRAEKGSTWDETQGDLDDLDRSDDLVRLVVLDTWLRNTDRHMIHRGIPVPNKSNVYISAERSIGKFSRLIAIGSLATSAITGKRGGSKDARDCRARRPHLRVIS